MAWNFILLILLALRNGGENWDEIFLLNVWQVDKKEDEKRKKDVDLFFRYLSTVIQLYRFHNVEL
jgi:hypothetical protein